MSDLETPRAESLRAGKSASALYGLDTLVAVPQWYVNFNLANLLKHGKTTDGKPLGDVDLSLDGKHRLQGTIGRLWTAIHVPDAPSRVKFILSFSSGTLDYFENQRCDISGLQFGFEVNLSRTAVEQDASLPPDVKKQVEALIGNLAGGSFGIHQLFMDLQNAALAQYDRSVTVIPAGMPQPAVDTLPGYLGQYLAQLAKAGGNVLGYAVTVDPGADLPASFPPTSLRFATNQYQGGDDGKTLNPDLDTINYQMMTGGAAFPANPPSWWGNFVEPGDVENGWYGTMALNNRLFVQDFLLPKLKLIVLRYMRFSNRDDGTLAPGYEVCAGEFTPSQYGGTWESGRYQGRSHRTNTVSNDDVEYAMDAAVELSVLPATNRIAISRRTHFDVKYTHWYGIEDHAAKSELHLWYLVPLDIQIELRGAQDGKLQVAVTARTKEPDPNMEYGSPYDWYIVDHSGSYSGWTGIDANIGPAIKAMVDVAIPVALLDEVEQAIADELNLRPFVFPGSSQLFLANPVFNNEGDLLLGVQYKV